MQLKTINETFSAPTFHPFSQAPLNVLLFKIPSFYVLLCKLSL